MKIKRLNLPSWVTYDYKRHQLFKPEDCLLGTYRYPEIKVLETDGITIPFNKNGWYCVIGSSWFEINNKLYLAGESFDESEKSFKYCLEQLNYQPITDFEYQILKKLSVYGNFPELNRAIGQYQDYLHFRNIKIEAFRIRKELNLFKRNK